MMEHNFRRRQAVMLPDLSSPDGWVFKLILTVLYFSRM